MKKSILVISIFLSTISYSQQQEYLLDFEPYTPSGVVSNWYTFDNDPAPAEIVDNPDLDGTNASNSKVLKVVVGPENAFYAGVNNAWNESVFGTWEIEMGVSNNLTLTMDVRKNYIGTLGIKMGTAGQGTSFQITDQNIDNNIVDEWQTLSWDLSGINPAGDLTNISQMVVFVDWTEGSSDRAENSTIYLDNIRFNAKKLTDAPLVDTPSLEGSWSLTQESGALGVGPNPGDYGWWSSSEADVALRSCLFDDEYVFNADSSFINVVGEDTWLESWQGADPDACGTPVAPHNGTNAAYYTVDTDAGTVTIVGSGAYLGLPKITNTGEDGFPNNDTTVYSYVMSADGNSVDFTIQGFNAGVATAEWIFKMTKNSETAGVANFASSSVKMYPNPANGTINFSTASNAILQVAVYDMLGKQVLRSDRVKSQLDISSLQPGMYFVNMTQGTKITTKKLVVN